MMPTRRTCRAEFDTCLVLCSADRAAVRQWAPSYQRATWMQAPLALVSFVAGVAVWLRVGGGGWLVAAGWSALSYLSHSLSSCRLTIGCSRLVGNRTPATQGFC